MRLRWVACVALSWFGLGLLVAAVAVDVYSVPGNPVRLVGLSISLVASLVASALFTREVKR